SDRKLATEVPDGVIPVLSRWSQLPTSSGTVPHTWRPITAHWHGRCWIAQKILWMSLTDLRFARRGDTLEVSHREHREAYLPSENYRPSLIGDLHMASRGCLHLLVAAMLAVAAGLGQPAAAHAQNPAKKKIEFNRDIRPILANNCLACHGPDNNL